MKTALELISDVDDAVKALHRHPDLSGQDRASIMVAIDLVRNTTPHRAHRAAIVDAMVRDSEDHALGA